MSFPPPDATYSQLRRNTLAVGVLRGTTWGPLTEGVARQPNQPASLLLTIRLEVEVMIDQLDREDEAEEVRRD